MGELWWGPAPRCLAGGRRERAQEPPRRHYCPWQLAWAWSPQAGRDDPRPGGGLHSGRAIVDSITARCQCTVAIGLCTGATVRSESRFRLTNRTDNCGKASGLHGRGADRGNCAGVRGLLQCSNCKTALRTPWPPRGSTRVRGSRPGQEDRVDSRMLCGTIALWCRWQSILDAH